MRNKIPKPEKNIRILTNSEVLIVSILLLIVFLFGMFITGKVMLSKQKKMTGAAVSNANASDVKTKTVKEAEATIMSTGDVLIHDPIYNSVKNSDGTFDFSSCFRHLKTVVSSADYSVFNMECTLADGSTGYSGFPIFKTPDSLVPSLKDVGFDMAITANNHSADSGSEGVIRTAKVIRAAGLDQTGTKTSSSEKNYKIITVNGINIGMINYTYGVINQNGRVSLNGNAALTSEVSKCINVFDYSKLNDFYQSAEKDIAAMKNDGADAVIFYLHWGTEYNIKQSEIQETIAKKLAELGVDAIIGGHPHVIQPFKTIKGKDGKRVPCIYSMGNFISNQRKNIMDDSRGYTEDGILFNLTFHRNSDGKVFVKSCSYIPLWVNLYTADSKRHYEVVPLHDLSNPDALGLNKISNGLKQATASKERTDSLVKSGIDEFNAGLGGQAEESTTPKIKPNERTTGLMTTTDYVELTTEPTSVETTAEKSSSSQSDKRIKTN